MIKFQSTIVSTVDCAGIVCQDFFTAPMMRTLRDVVKHKCTGFNIYTGDDESNRTLVERCCPAAQAEHRQVLSLSCHCWQLQPLTYHTLQPLRLCCTERWRRLSCVLGRASPGAQITLLLLLLLLLVVLVQCSVMPTADEPLCPLQREHSPHWSKPSTSDLSNDDPY